MPAHVSELKILFGTKQVYSEAGQGPLIILDDNADYDAAESLSQSLGIVVRRKVLTSRTHIIIPKYRMVAALAVDDVQIVIPFNSRRDAIAHLETINNLAIQIRRQTK